MSGSGSVRFLFPARQKVCAPCRALCTRLRAAAGSAALPVLLSFSSVLFLTFVWFVWFALLVWFIH